MTDLLYQTDSYLKEFDALITAVDQAARSGGARSQYLPGRRRPTPRRRDLTAADRPGRMRAAKACRRK